MGVKKGTTIHNLFETELGRIFTQNPAKQKWIFLTIISVIVVLSRSKQDTWENPCQPRVQSIHLQNPLLKQVKLILMVKIQPTWKKLQSESVWAKLSIIKGIKIKPRALLVPIIQMKNPLPPNQFKPKILFPTMSFNIEACQIQKKESKSKEILPFWKMSQ